MNLPKRLFWDVSYESIDWEKNADFVISRVSMRGDLNDWFELKRHYGLTQIKTALLGARYLDEMTHHFFSVYFSVPKEKFRCFFTKQSNPQHWPF